MTGVDTTVAYHDGRLRITDLLRPLPPERGSVVVPACPEWTVKDVAAHLCGIDADVLAGRLDGVATDEWTDAQVRARAGRTLAEVLDEWDEIGPEVETRLAGGLAPPQMVADLATHEHDIRHALAAPGGRDAASTAIAVDFMLTQWSDAFPVDAYPPLRLVVEDRTVQVGDAEPATTLRLSPFEALRALTGRQQPGPAPGLPLGHRRVAVAARLHLGPVHPRQPRHRGVISAVTAPHAVPDRGAKGL